MPARARTIERPSETYNAITSTYKLVQRKIAQMLSEEGLTRPQFQVLRVVANIGATPMKGISDEMLVTPSNITGIIDRLQSKGFIKRMARQKGDRRTTIIELTQKGRALHEKVAAAYGEFMNSALQVLTLEEQRTLRDLLVKLQEGMSQSGK